MAKKLATQPSMNPTRKLSAATVTSALMAVSGLVVQNLWPTWFDAVVWLAMTPVVTLAVGWFIKDDAQVVVLTPDEYRDAQ